MGVHAASRLAVGACEKFKAAHFGFARRSPLRAEGSGYAVVLF